MSEGDRLFEATGGPGMMSRTADVPLREHLEALISSVEKRLQLHEAETDRALSLASGNVEERVRTSRQVLDAKDSEQEKHPENNDRRLTVLENTVSNFQGRVWALGAVLALGLTILSIVLHQWGPR